MRKRSLLAVVAAAAAASLLLGPIAPVRSTSFGTAGVYRFIGAGFGHGVGMSQHGAKAYADGGASAGAILTKFYSGTAISSAPQPALRVWLANATTATEFNTSGPIRATSDNPPAGPAFVDTTPQGANRGRISIVEGGLALSQGPNLLLGPVAGPIVLSPGASPHSLCSGIAGTSPCVGLTATNRRYRFGAIEFSRVGTSNTIRIVIRDLPMQQYLYGLGEMPSSWHLEALKAQAVAGRTYALEKVRRLGQNRAGCACGLLATTADQHYIGFEKEAETRFFPNWRRAVDETDQVIVTHNGAPIQALYHASSGGHTEHNEYVFGGSPLPSLRGVPDPGDAAVSPWRAWVRAYSGSELSGWLNANSATAVGTLQAVEVHPPYGVSGIPGRIRLVGSSGEKVVSATTFRSVVNAAVPFDRELPAPLFQLGYEAYGRDFRGGVFVTGGGHGGALYIATGAGEGGGPHVRAFRFDGTGIGSFFAYGAGFTGGVRVAACDVTGNGHDEIITGAGPGGGPHVRIFTATGDLVSNGFFAFGEAFRGGIYVGCANVDGQGPAEIVVGAGAGGGPHVRVFRASGELVDQWFAYGESFRGGVRVAGGDLAGDGRHEVVTAAGPGGGPHVRAVGNVGAGRFTAGEFFAYDAGFTGGVYVAVVPGAPKGAIVSGTGEPASHVRARRLDSGNLLDMGVFGGPMGHGARVGAAGPAVLASTGPATWPVVRHVP